MSATPDAIARQVRAARAAGDATKWWPVRGDLAAVPDGYTALDFSQLTAIRHLDVTSAVVWVEAGATWSEVEAVLAPRALTLGPLPTWVADRPIFQSLAEDDRLRPSPRHGQLTDGLLALRAVLPDGALSQAPVSPRRATGPDLPRCVLGAAHRAGYVTDVHLQAWPRARSSSVQCRAFDGFSEALAAAVAVLRAGIRPAWWQVLRGRGDVRLVAELATTEDGAGFNEAAQGRLATPPPGPEPSEIKAVFSGGRAAAAAFAEAHPGARICDIRPEAATVYLARGRAQAVAEWPALATAFFDQLGGPR